MGAVFAGRSGDNGWISLDLDDHDVSVTPALELARDMREQAEWCERLGSRFYAMLLLRIAGNVETGGLCWSVLESRAGDPTRMKLPLRFLGGVHRLVLEGKLPEVARSYPSLTGPRRGAGDADAAFEALLAALPQREDQIRASIPDTVQYSEPRRSAALLPGFLEVARKTKLPLRLVELGSSAGLNLRWDCYGYETRSGSWGPVDSPLVFRDPYEGEPPAFDVTARVVERCGCDLNPIDPVTDDGRLTLQSFLWPDQPDRFERLARAIEVARKVPVKLDRAEAVGWLERRLASPRPGIATVVFHSIVLLYLSNAAKIHMEALLEKAGARATAEAPLAWLSMEPEAGQAGIDAIDLTLWPGGERRRIATAGFHAGKVSVTAPYAGRLQTARL
jgi:hypothetical protein